MVSPRFILCLEVTHPCLQYRSTRFIFLQVEAADEAEQERTGLWLLLLNHTRESNQEVDQADQ